MSFNVQSEFLDLKKVYQNFQYQALIAEEVVVAQGLVIEEKKIYQGMTQNTYLFVTEKFVLIKDIQNLSLYFTHKRVRHLPNIREKAFKNFPFDKIIDRVCYIFQKYQQQPSLLDTLLQQLILPIMNSIKQYLYIHLSTQELPCQEFDMLLTIIYQLTKVRGAKYTTKYFPHQVKDLEPAIGYLVRWRSDNNILWQSKYIIILWLSVIILVPFDLDTIDSKNISIQNQKGEKISQMVELLLETSKFYLKSSSKMREAAAIFLSKIFTRPDIQKRNLLPIYINYVLLKLSELKDDQINSFFVCGLYASLYYIFKTVNRSELLDKIGPILEQIRKQSKDQKQSPAKKLLKIKLLTRIGLVYLKPRVAKWAYRKSKTSLKQNLNKTGSKLKTNTSNLTNIKTQQNYGQIFQNELQYYKDVKKQNLQEIIDLIIDQLSEKETSIRQAASKGLGKICGRLSQDMTLDILDHILDLNPSPQTQHSICLTLAELIRRNLLSPQKLRSLYLFIHQSLLYQKQEGGYSIGQAVRDSACYMAWAVARGYEQGGQLGIYLMIAACFDRQVGCRRAASAAYQQLVGRVGGVPNGIQILTEADYFTLGLQKNSYLNVGIFVASFQAYFKPFAQHLGYQKLRHWDIQIKKISACSLSLMTPLNPEFMAKQLLPSLVNYLSSDIMTIKLGSIIGISELLIGLSGKSHMHLLHNQMKDSVFLKSLTQNEKKLMYAGQYMTIFKQKYEKQRYNNNLSLVDNEITKKILDVIKKYISQNIFKGKSGQNFRISTCRLIQAIAIAEIPLQIAYINQFTAFLEDNIKNPLQIILNAAVKSLKRFSAKYHIYSQQKKFIDNLIHNSTSNLPHSKGYTLAVASLSPQIHRSAYFQIMNALQSNCKILKDKQDDAERRKNAILGLESIVYANGFDNQFLNNGEIDRIINILIKTTNDYSTDKRGDIGSIVRQASMKTLLNIIQLYVKTNNTKTKIKNELIYLIIANILQQLSQKIDRIRLLAGSLLQSFFDHYSHKFQIPRHKQLKAIFEQQNIKRLIKEGQDKIDKNLQTEVIEMQMKIQQNIFHQTDKELIYYWNLPHCVFPLIIPLLEYKQYSYYILKGISTSAGGISQSIIKYSLQQLGNYVTYLKNNNYDSLIEQLIDQSITILEKSYRDQRVIIPMYKTLDFLLQREQIMNWPSLNNFSVRLYNILAKQCNKSKSILKISSAVGPYVQLLTLNNSEIQNKILLNIVGFLSSDLPKVRKILADKLLLLVMSQQDFKIFDEAQSEQLTMILSQYQFVDQKLDVEFIKTELMRIFRLE